MATVTPSTSTSGRRTLWTPSDDATPAPQGHPQRRGTAAGRGALDTAPESGADAAGPGRHASRASRSARKRPSSLGAAGPRRRPPPGTPAVPGTLSGPGGPVPGRRGGRHDDQQQPARRPWPVPGRHGFAPSPADPAWLDLDTGHQVIRVRAPARRDHLPVLPGPAPGCLYEARFSPGTPDGVITAAIDAALSPARPGRGRPGPAAGQRRTREGKRDPR